MFTDCQSGFIPGDSCILQLPFIAQEIHRSFDCTPTEDVTGVFLDISKHSDKVWHEELIFKLKKYGVEKKNDFSLRKLLKKPKPKGSLNSFRKKKNTSSGFAENSVGTTSPPHIYK